MAPALVRSVYRTVLPTALRSRIRDKRYARIRRVNVQLPAPPDGSVRPRQVRLSAPSGFVIPRMLAATGLAGYEPETLATFLAAVDHAPPGAVLDIGANVGVYGLLARALSDRDVHAFEPVPALAEIAIRTSVDNQLPYAVVQQAVGRAPGEATLYLSDVSDSSNSLNPRFRTSSRSLTVSVTTVDQYVAMTGIAPSIIKIDTETFEPDVLAGARETMRAHRPWLLVEVLPGRTEAALTEEMSAWGYSWYRCVGDPPYDARTDLLAIDDTAAPMWLMLPAPATDAFWARALDWLAALRNCTP